MIIMTIIIIIIIIILIIIIAMIIIIIIIIIIITIPPFILTSLIKDFSFLIEAPWVLKAHLSTLPRPVVSYRAEVVAPF